MPNCPPRSISRSLPVHLIHLIQKVLPTTPVCYFHHGAMPIAVHSVLVAMSNPLLLPFLAFPNSRHPVRWIQLFQQDLPTASAFYFYHREKPSTMHSVFDFVGEYRSCSIFGPWPPTTPSTSPYSFPSPRPPMILIVDQYGVHRTRLSDSQANTRSHIETQYKSCLSHEGGNFMWLN